MKRRYQLEFDEELAVESVNGVDAKERIAKAKKSFRPMYLITQQRADKKESEKLDMAFDCSYCLCYCCQPTRSCLTIHIQINLNWIPICHSIATSTKPSFSTTRMKQYEYSLPSSACRSTCFFFFRTGLETKLIKPRSYRRIGGISFATALPTMPKVSLALDQQTLARSSDDHLQSSHGCGCSMEPSQPPSRAHGLSSTLTK